MSTRNALSFLALWNGISGPDMQAEYEMWHTFEHVPERVGFPGFVEARRYRSITQPLRYYTCYWLENAGALATPQYRDVVENPTPWSARMRLHMRDFLRMPCSMGGMHGNSPAARLIALHLQSDDDNAGQRIDTALRQLVSRASLVNAQWGEAQPADDYPLANTTAGAGARNQLARHQFVVMIGHLDDAVLTSATQVLLQSLASHTTPVSPPDHCEFLSQVRHADLATPTGTRQPPRADLLATFTQGDKP